MSERVKDLVSFADEIRDAGFRDVVLLGMGGSSQSAELFATTFPSAPGYPKLHVLDTTVPEAIRSLDRNIDITRTLFVVASKTGETIETLSHFKSFFERVKVKSSNPAGSHFIAITDPGTRLAAIAKEHRFRRVFLNPPDIVGCFAVISYFGLVPAALIGMDVATLVDRAIRMAHKSAGCVRVEENPGVSLGAALGALMNAGRDKLTFIISPPISSFGLWVEQLIAESTAKDGDRYHSGLRRADGRREVLRQGPRVRLPEAQQWRRCRAGCGVRGDQASWHPDRANHVVGQNRSRRRVHALGNRSGDRWRGDRRRSVRAACGSGEQRTTPAAFSPSSRAARSFPSRRRLQRRASLTLFSDAATADALRGKGDFRAMLGAFMNLTQPGDYFATMAYVSPNPTVDKEIAAIRKAVVERYGVATTFGYGPRCLHSTGQLHKGGPNIGTVPANHSGPSRVDCYSGRSVRFCATQPGAVPRRFPIARGAGPARDSRASGRTRYNRAVGALRREIVDAIAR